MTILKKMKKKFYSINKNQWDKIKEDNEKEYYLRQWKQLRDSLNLK